MNTEITNFLKKINARTVLPEWLSAKEMIESEFSNFKKIIASDPPPNIYGVTTLVGHLDKIKISKDQIEKSQSNLISNHLLDMGVYYNKWEFSSVLFCKIQHYSQGGSAISGTLYQGLIDLFSEEETFLKIPKNSSYSCGDVIPGAHFANAIKINFGLQNKSLMLKDSLSLLNGMFIQTGLALSSVPSLRYTLDILIDNSIHFFCISQANSSSYSTLVYKKGWINRLCAYFEKNIPSTYHDTQDSVSIRSTPQLIDSLNDSIHLYEECILEMLDMSSDNPLIINDTILSQSSFFSPKLATKLENCINSLLFVCGMIERRTHYLLSGNFSSISLNASNENNPLGLIQIPKLMTSILEETRLKNGRRAFAAGSSTSYGIEDIYCMGIPLIEQLYDVLETVNSLMRMESIVFNYLKDFNYENLKEQFKTVYKAVSMVQRNYHEDFIHLHLI